MNNIKLLNAVTENTVGTALIVNYSPNKSGGQKAFIYLVGTDFGTGGVVNFEWSPDSGTTYFKLNTSADWSANQFQEITIFEGMKLRAIVTGITLTADLTAGIVF